jgi:hypothetical protein
MCNNQTINYVYKDDVVLLRTIITADPSGRTA